MQALRWTGAAAAFFDDTPVGDYLDQIGDNEAIVAPRKTGICGSDMHFYRHGRILDYQLNKNNPTVLGHEFAGIVIKAGKNTSLKPGDKVAVEPGSSCLVCTHCQDGRYHVCRSQVFAGSPELPNLGKHDGCLQTFYKSPAHLLYKLPAHVSLEEGALIEPLAVAMHALHFVGKFQTGQNIVVSGAGPVGLLGAAAARALGARRIIVVEANPARLEFAKNYISEEVFLPPAKKEGESNLAYSARAAAALQSQLGVTEDGPECIDMMLECSGAQVCTQMGYYLVRVDGTIVQVGLGGESIQVPVMQHVFKEITFKGSVKYGAGIYKLCIDLVARRKIDLKPLVSHRFAFKDAMKAYESMALGHGPDGKPTVKVIIDGPDIDSSLLNGISLTEEQPMTNGFR